MANGSVVIGRDTYSQGDSEEIPIPADGLVIGGTSDEYTITVDPGQGETAAFSISGLSLTASGDNSLIDIKSGSATITLTGENTLTGVGGNFSAPLRISDGQALTVEGDGRCRSLMVRLMLRLMVRRLEAVPEKTAAPSPSRAELPG